MFLPNRGVFLKIFIDKMNSFRNSYGNFTKGKCLRNFLNKRCHVLKVPAQKIDRLTLTNVPGVSKIQPLLRTFCAKNSTNVPGVSKIHVPSRHYGTVCAKNSTNVPGVSKIHVLSRHYGTACAKNSTNVPGVSKIHLLLRHYATAKDCCNSNQNYHKDCERAINEQILAELNAAYDYLSMACYFGRSNVALPGCHGFFMKMHEEEMGHARKFICYQNMRGGRVMLQPVECSECTEWDIKKALEASLEMEKFVKEKLVSAHNVGEQHKDLNLADMIVSEFISEQEKSICEFSRLLARYNSMSDGCNCSCSDFLFDKHMFSAFIKNASKENERYV